MFLNLFVLIMTEGLTLFHLCQYPDTIQVHVDICILFLHSVDILKSIKQFVRCSHFELTNGEVSLILIKLDGMQGHAF